MARPPIHPAFAALLPPMMAAPAPADARVQEPAALVADLAYDKCSAFIDGRMALEGDPVLTAQGFGPAVRCWVHPVSGQVAFRDRATTGLRIAFGGAPGSLCQVNMVGDASADLLAKMRTEVGRLPYRFEADPSRSGPQANGAKVETLRAVVSDRDYVFVQFVRATVHGEAVATFQLKDMRL